jgi:hypothetical protein
MLRSSCVVLGFVALLLPAPADVGAVTLVKAFKAGQADQFKNKQVSGTGISFHGAIKEHIADGSTRTSLVVTLGAVAANGQLTPVTRVDEFVAAEQARTTLVVALSGPDLPNVSPEPTTMAFSGVYDGQVRTIMRAPQAAEGTDSGPCPGEQVRDMPGSFHCAPLLTNATASVRIPDHQILDRPFRSGIGIPDPR